MPSHVLHQISLRHRATKLSRAWTTCYRMHMAGLENMTNDARERLAAGEFFEFKILKEEVPSCAIVQTMLRESQKKPVDNQPKRA